MNVAIFTDNDFDKVNGVTTTLTAALQFAPADARLRVYTAAALGVDQPHYLALPSIGVPIPCYGEMQMYLPRLREYVRRARKDEIDVVHLTTPGPIGLAAMYVSWRLNLPIVGSFHADLAAYIRVLSGSPRLGAMMRGYLRWQYGRCARVLVPSEHTRALLVRAGVDPAKIRVWPHGVDTSLFSPTRRSTRLREVWHVSDRRPAILYAGRLSREKGLQVLAPLQRRLNILGIEHRLVLAGEGPMMAALRELLPDAMFTGTLSRAAMAEAFASADLFVFPSRTDAAGNVILEAQASGLPVIVAGEGAPRESMWDGRTGVICQSEDVAAWASAVARLLRDRVCHAAMASAARGYALTRRWVPSLQPLYGTYRELSAAAAPYRLRA